MKQIVFEDSIILYWEKEWEAKGAPEYSVYLNGALLCTTEKTHATVRGLTPDCDYGVRVERLFAGERSLLFEAALHTPAARRRIDVTLPPYSAVGDGNTVNTRALQAAIDDCRAGEAVYLPAGTYLTGALDLHSDMELYVEAGAVLQGVTEASAYLPKVRSRFEGWEMDCYRALLNIGKMDSAGGYTCGNIVLRGGGSILGGGRALSDNVIRAERAALMATGTASDSECDAIAPRARGRLIQIANTDGVIIDGLALGYGAAWNVHFVYSRNVVTCNGSITSDGVPNGDGWDPDSSEDSTVFHMEFNTGDDGIAIKSGKNPEGNRIARPTRGIRIFDCHGKDGIAIGSELSGGVEDVAIWDCDMRHERARRGFRIKTTRKRGGYVRHIKVKDAKFAQIIIYTLYGCNDDGEGADGQLTEISDISLVGVESTGKVAHWGDKEGYVEHALCLQVAGFEECPIRNLHMEDITVGTRTDLLDRRVKIENTEGLILKSLTATEE